MMKKVMKSMVKKNKKMRLNSVTSNSYSGNLTRWTWKMRKMKKIKKAAAMIKNKKMMKSYRASAKETRNNS